LVLQARGQNATSLFSWSGKKATPEHLDVLVNNAGILEKDDKSVLTVSAGTVLRTFTTNTLGPLLVTQAFLPLL
jgi:NAD(P)-dependent dehydrogenase (short-subunit alcohol dehydrogenase family)